MDETHFIFVMETYYPSGGFGDLVFTTTDDNEARAHWNSLALTDYQWAEWWVAAPGERPLRIDSTD